MAKYTARQVGAPNTLDYRVFIGMCEMGSWNARYMDGRASVLDEESTSWNSVLRTLL